MILTVLIISVVLLFIGMSPSLRRPIMSRLKKTQLLGSPTAGLSDVAKHLYREYMELPEDSRPLPDIISVLKGLDAATAHDPVGRQNHYDESYYMRSSGYSANLWRYEFAWTPSRVRDGTYRRCHRSSCEFHAYYDLHEEIQQVKNQLAEKERVLNQKKNEHHVNTAQALVEALRREREIQRQVTHELE